MTTAQRLFLRSLARNPLLVDSDRLFFSITSFLGIVVTLFVCMWASLPWPWLAMMLGYITAQSLPGAGRPKLLHRLGGVALGAVVALAVVPNLQNSPVLLVLAMAIWTGGFMFLAVRDRGPRAAFYQMSAFSGAIIAFPNVDSPATIFLTATCRVEEMTIGIVAVTVAHILLRPWRVQPMVQHRARTFLADAAAWTYSALGERRTELAHEQRRKLAADVTELGIIATHLPSVRAGRVPLPQLARTLQAQLATILPHAAGVADRYDRLHERGPLPAEIDALMADARAWLRTPASAAAVETDALEARCAALADIWAERDEPDALLIANLCQRIGELIAAHHDAQRDLAALSGEAWPLVPETDAIRRIPPTRDLTVPVMAGLGTATALILLCIFWISTAWPSGAATSVFATLMGTSFNTQDDPAPFLGRYIVTLALALPLALAYLCFLLPAVDGFAMLVTMLAPALIALGYLQASPKYAPTAFPILSCFIVATFLTARYHFDFASVVNTWLSQIGGALAALVAAKLFRSVSMTWVAERMIRAQWREIEELATAPGRVDAARWTIHGLDRLGQIAARLAQTSTDNCLHAADGLDDLRIGQELLRIRTARDEGPAQDAVGRLLDEIGRLYRGRRRTGQVTAPPPALLEAIEETIGALRALPDQRMRDDALLAAVGLRCDLVPAHPLAEAA